MAFRSLRDCANILMGTHVVVENEEGHLYTGILRSITDELEVELSFAQQLPISEDSKFILSNKNAIKNLKMKATRMSGDYYGKEQEKVFRTDAEIGINGGDFEADKEFQHWEDDGEEYLDGICDLNEKEKESRNGRWKKKTKKNTGWSVDEMFEANKDKCYGESSFDENLTQYSNVDVGERTEEELKRAEKLARQIEMNPTSRRNALLENDDEERDLDAITNFKGEVDIEKRHEIPKQSSHPKPQPSHRQPSPLNVVKTENNDRKQQQNEEEQSEEKKEKVKEITTEEHQEEEDKKSKFTFNPAAAPFVPKQRDLISTHHPSVSSANISNNNNFSSQLQTFVQLPAVQIASNAQIPHGLPPPNLLFNNAILYPQQQQTVMPNAIPLYAYTGNSALSHQPTAVFVQPNHTAVLLQQQGVAQQQFVPITSAMVHQNHQQSRTGTPTNGAPMHQHPQQPLVDTTTGNPHIHQPAHTTTIFHNPIQTAQTGPVLTGVSSALPLMNIVPQIPPPAMLQGTANTAYSQQMVTNGTYVGHHQQYPSNHQQQPALQQPHPLSRSNSVQPQHLQFQPVNIQNIPQHAVNQQSMAGIYATNPPPYAQSLMQQSQYQMPFYVQQHPTVIPSASVPPPLTHHIPSAGHGQINNMIGRQQQY